MRFNDYEQDCEVVLEAHELRAIIRGELGFRKCPDCQGECESWTLHYTLKNDPTETEQTMEVSAQFAADFDVDNPPEEYSWAECYCYTCETCHGVGYIPMEVV
jgi:hypothetical protein